MDGLERVWRGVVWLGSVLAVLVGLWLGVPVAKGAERAEERAGAEDARFLRTIEKDDGARMRLEASIRTFRPANGEGPKVHLVSAVHIGEESYYRTMQAFLDEQSLVLYEGIRPPGAGDMAHEASADEVTDEHRAAATRRRVNLVGSLLSAYLESQGSYPASIEALWGWLPGDFASSVRDAKRDAWDEPLVYERTDEGFRLRGGRDGDGVEPVTLTEADAPPPMPVGGGQDGIQQRLADALGLVFQIAVMDHSGPQWRNSDLSVDQLSRRLRRADGRSDADALMQTMGGAGITGRLANTLVGMIGRSEQVAEIVKAVLLETLSLADELLEVQGGRLMEVILEERNHVVLHDLGRAIAEHGPDESIGVIYGAGHMPGIEKGLVEDMGYEHTQSQWIPAILVDLEAVGVNPQAAAQMRRFFRTTIEAEVQRGGRSR